MPNVTQKPVQQVIIFFGFIIQFLANENDINMQFHNIEYLNNLDWYEYNCRGPIDGGNRCRSTMWKYDANDELWNYFVIARKHHFIVFLG